LGWEEAADQRPPNRERRAPKKRHGIRFRSAMLKNPFILTLIY